MVFLGGEIVTHKTKNILFWTGVFIIFLLIPIVVQDSYNRHLFIMAFIFAIVASNWDITLGYTGIFNFGHMAFMGLGVYTAGIGTKVLGINPFLVIPLGGIIACLGAVLCVAPVVRLKGIYVVLVTFAFGQIIYQLILSQAHITGGSEGIVRLPYLRIGDYTFIRDYKLGYYYIALLVLTLNLLVLHFVTTSIFGKSLKAIRDNEHYAQSRGISIARQRIKAFVLSAFFTGIAGAFYGVYLRVASPDIFAFSLGALVLSMVLIGGVNSIWGPALMALIITFSSEKLAAIPGFEDIRFLIIAILMILVLRITPGGLQQLLGNIYKKYYLR